jgi:FG-GAP-like repeat
VGNDKIGRITTAGVVTEYAIPRASTGPTSITVGPDGAFWFSEQFANRIGRLAVTANTHDSNGDIFSDIQWRDTAGNLGIWLMQGASVLQSGGVGGVPNSWSIVGQRDFNGDFKTDLLWRDNLGNVAIWLMSGNAVLASLAVGNVPTSWTVIGTGDFNGDGKGDLLWRDK